MSVWSHFTIIAALSCAAMFSALAQSSSLSPSAETKAATGSISGRVTVSGQPGPGVIVILQPLSDSTSSPRPPNVKATTDDEGRYRLTGVAAGKYILTATGSTFATPIENIYGYPGKAITVAEGDKMEGMDLVLAPGGVITGRVTYASGAPLINGQIVLTQIVEQGPQRPFYESYENRSLRTTDDRGLYRIYGLPAGHYIVGVVENPFDPHPSYPATFSPGVTDQEKAAVIDLAAGSESSDVNIKLSQILQAYSASGRFVDGETGQPLTINSRVLGSSKKIINGQEVENYSFGPGDNAAGEFRLDDLAPGRYTLQFTSQGSSDFYSDPVAIEVTDHDLTGLEIKAQRGASLSGVAIVDGDSNPAAFAQLSQFYASFFTRLPGNNYDSTEYGTFRIGADGSFRIAGLPPITFRFAAPPLGGASKGFTFLYVERDGVQLRNLELKAGEQVTGLRLIYTHHTGIVQGQVNIIGGALPQGTRIFARSLEAAGSALIPTLMDTSGRFTFENLPVGNYEISLSYPISASNSRTQIAAKQTITVTEGTVSPVTLTLDLTPKEKKQ